MQLNKEVKKLIVSVVEELKAANQLFTEWLLNLANLFENEKTDVVEITALSIDDIIFENASEIFKNKQRPEAMLEIFQTAVSGIFLNNEVIIKKVIRENKQVFSQRNFKEEVTKEANAQHQLAVDDFLHLNKPAVLVNDDLFYGENKDDVLTTKYLVKHAGIILLSPFLKFFFKNLNLLEANQWKTKDAQYKAFHLLKFISTGLQQTPEYNLTLEKIICGVAIEEPIPLEIILSENEINESQSLLESVIEHWKAIKNTSVNGLREAFLQRDGKLECIEGNWRLYVEHKTQDILLNRIPWGYSYIKLPWMKDMLSITWQ